MIFLDCFAFFDLIIRLGVTNNINMINMVCLMSSARDLSIRHIWYELDKKASHLEARRRQMNVCCSKQTSGSTFDNIGKLVNRDNHVVWLCQWRWWARLVVDFDLQVGFRRQRLWSASLAFHVWHTWINLLIVIIMFWCCPGSRASRRLSKHTILLKRVVLFCVALFFCRSRLMKGTFWINTINTD